MLTYEVAKSLVDQFSYKPGYRVELFEDWNDPQQGVLTVIGFVPNVEQPEVQVPVLHRRRVHLSTMYPDMLVHEVEAACQQLELHESREWLKLNGKHVTDPHPERKMNAPGTASP